MPRTARSIEADTVYHALNRGNGRVLLFHKHGAYDAFKRVPPEGFSRYLADRLGLEFTLRSLHPAEEDARQSVMSLFFSFAS